MKTYYHQQLFLHKNTDFNLRYDRRSVIAVIIAI